MATYLLKRLFLFIPALLLVSLLVFALSKATPGDPVKRMLQNSIEDGWVPDQRAYQAMAERLGLDKPAFYFSITAIAFPDTLHRIVVKDYQHSLSRLISNYGNWPEIQQYYHALQQLSTALQNTPDSMRQDDYIEVRRIGGQLFIQTKDEEISRLHGLMLETTNKAGEALPKDLTLAVSKVSQTYTNVKKHQSPWKLYIPDIKWWGFDNQYHHWIVNFAKGEFGTSFSDGRPVSRKMGEALWWTIIMNVIALLLIFLISIPLGIFLARKKGSRTDRYLSVFLFGLYSLPSFWVATLLLVFFTTSEYSPYLDLFAGPGLGELRQTAPLGDRFWERLSHMILPIFCLTYAALAYVTRQVRGSMLDTMDQDFVRTARAKGLNENVVLWKHAFRNALFPLITMMASILPGLLAGSVIVEFIFAIPGMGRLMYDSIFQQNWPIVYTVLLFTAILTMFGNLLADICYVWADPRVGFGKEE